MKKKETKIKKDCVMYDITNQGTHYCKALNVLNCANGECPFYKSKKDYKPALYGYEKR